MKKTEIASPIMRYAPQGLTRLKQVLIIFPVSPSTWHQGVKAGRFPAPTKFQGMNFWVAADIYRLIERVKNGDID